MDEPFIDWVMFGHWMRSRREGKGLTQEAAASEVEIHEQTWYRLENGGSTKSSTMQKIARFLATDESDRIRILAKITGHHSSSADQTDAAEEAILTLLQRKKDETGLSEETKKRLKQIAEEE